MQMCNRSVSQESWMTSNARRRRSSSKTSRRPHTVRTISYSQTINCNQFKNLQKHKHKRWGKIMCKKKLTKYFFSFSYAKGIGSAVLELAKASEERLRRKG